MQDIYVAYFTTLSSVKMNIKRGYYYFASLCDSCISDYIWKSKKGIKRSRASKRKTFS